MSSQLRSFPLKELKNNRFVFTVSGEFEYLIEFHLSHFNLPSSIQDIQLYELSFGPKNKPERTSSQMINDKIRNTIFTAIDYFLNKSDCVLMYICDSSDKRELARHRLFAEKWYPLSKENFDVDLINRVVKDQELGDIYYTGILMKRDFELYDHFLNEFKNPEILNK